ncbi:hypothetical protein D6D10_06541 [Aureobasidium pullulans]|uniref:D-isomer specific 2-hydroxyacid dehydrogenase NAD-binding domain-containing protein n=1 Tax=Aureobasidium pullulans TaxID=5580 RepID=A0A4S9EQ80_AURPU|nr:hypothetical protein D6D10_06541 [Aureobasidium pullulans]
MGGGEHKEAVLVTLPMQEPHDAIERLQKKFPHLKITYRNVSWTKDRAQLEKEVDRELWKEATVLLTLSALPPKPSDAPLLDFIQLFSAGSNQLASHPIYTDTDIPIATASGVHGPQIAEWVIMTHLIHTHKYNQLYDAQKQHKWGSKDGSYRVSDSVGMRVGVLGYGSIGRQVGRVAKAMGMDVIAFTASPKDTPEKKKDVGYIVPGTGDPDGEIPSAWYSGLDKESLHNFLKQDIDLLLISVPLTKETTHFLSTEEFKVLSQNGKRPAYVTNIARGPIIDQPALIEALKSDTLAGASLDVTDPEPLPSDNELWDLENVIVTPHISGNGAAYVDRAFQILELQLEHKQKGEKYINVVNRKRGY